ncbi:MAG: CBS domain-containing protein [Syntrophales bacterium]
MKNYTITELMLPLSEYATVPAGSTLLDAVLALEKAQEAFNHHTYKHRAILILDKEKRVVGKLSQLDVLRALEPKEEDGESLMQLARFGFSRPFIRDIQKQKRLKGAPLKDLYTKAMSLKVEEFMQTPTEGEYVAHDASLDIAIHQLVRGDHLSLLVTREKDIVGILRLTDVFAAIFCSIKDYEHTLT